MSTTPRPPRHLGERGKDLYRRVVADWELTVDSLLILEQAAATADRIQALEELVTTEGLVSKSQRGKSIHPAAVEQRHQRALLQRLLKALDLEPADDDDPKQPRTGRGRFAPWEDGD